MQMIKAKFSSFYNVDNNTCSCTRNKRTPAFVLNHNHGFRNKVLTNEKVEAIKNLIINIEKSK